MDSWRKLRDQLGAPQQTDGFHRVCESHATAIQKRMKNRLESYVSCTLNSIREMSYGDYIGSFTPDHHLYTYNLEPLGGRATIDFDTDCLNAVVYRDGGLQGTHAPGEKLTGDERKVFTPSVRDTLASWKRPSSHTWGSRSVMRHTVTSRTKNPSPRVPRPFSLPGSSSEGRQQEKSESATQKTRSSQPWIQRCGNSCQHSALPKYLRHGKR